MPFFKFLFPLVSLLLNFGCSRNSEHIFIADQLTEQTADQLKKEKGLSLIAIGGQMMGDIQTMGVEFQYLQLLNIEEARKMIIYTVHTYLKNINSNKKIRPYLHNYPFTINNVRVAILVCQPDGDSPSKGNIRHISISRGILTYTLARPDKTSRMPILLEETYAEALKIVEENP